MEKKRKRIALATSRIYDPQTFSFIANLNETLKVHDCALLVFAINSDIYWDESLLTAEAYVYNLIPYDDIDLVIIMDEKIKSHTVSDEIISKAESHNLPVIVIDGKYENSHNICFDYDRGFEQIVRHMFEHHQVKRPHMIAGLPANPFSDARIRIFMKILEEKGIPFDDSMLSYGYFWADPAREATEKLLQRPELPDAIICANDIMAINVCDVLKAAGISVPDQVLVSGFDGFDEVNFTSPMISTVSCNTTLLASSAAKMALDCLENKPVEDVYIIPELIPNESCGCPAHMDRSHTRISSFNNSFYRHQDDARVLYTVSSNMEISGTPEEMAQSIKNYKTNDCLCVVDQKCFDSEKNYFLLPEEETNAKNLHLIFDSAYAETHEEAAPPSVKETPNPFENVLAGDYRDRILELTESGYPVIFNSLDYMNQPLGFICFYFRGYIITDYARSASVTNAISMGIGGYINLRHQRALLQKVDEMYRHDALTDLYNRIGFNKIFEAEMKKKENLNKPITIIMSDMDGLKYINDNFGHADGDRSITAVAKALMDSCPEGSLSARFGGDELFSVIIGDCDADGIIKKIDEHLLEYNRISDLPYTVTTSCGYYTTNLDSEFDLMKVLRLADERMYDIKKTKRMRKEIPGY